MNDKKERIVITGKKVMVVVGIFAILGSVYTIVMDLREFGEVQNWFWVIMGCVLGVSSIFNGISSK